MLNRGYDPTRNGCSQRGRRTLCPAAGYPRIPRGRVVRQPRDCGIKSRGVAHLAIEVTCRKRAGHGTDRARMRMSRSSDHRIRFISGSFFVRIPFGPAMWQCISTPPGMMTYPLASKVRSGRQPSLGGDTIATLNPDVLHLTINAIRGIVNASADILNKSAINSASVNG